LGKQKKESGKSDGSRKSRDKGNKTGKKRIDKSAVEKVVVTEEKGSCQKELDALIDLGRRLDLPTALQSQWVTDPETKEVWVPSARDGWINQHLKIRTKRQGNIEFKLNRAQREYSAKCTRQNIVLKARQVGVTSYIAARFFVQTITHKGTFSMQVAHDLAAAEEIFRIIHRFWNNLPRELQEGVLKTSHSNVRELVFPELDSGYAVASADENAGRGRTIQNLHCTEVSRWGRDGAEALASLRAAVVPHGEIVLESTANGAWGTFHEEWQQAEQMGYTRHFFPWWFEESYAIEIGPSILVYTAEELAMVAEHGLTSKQMAWRRHQWATLRGMAVQEFAEDAVSCFRASGECVFDLDVVDQAMEMAREPMERRDSGRLAIWLPPKRGEEYVIGVDPAGGGVNGDYSCAQVIDRRAGTQCAELHGHLPHRDLALRLVKLAEEYNQAVLVVERNNHGAGVLAHLERMGYPKIYEEKGWNGWNTTAVSRPPMLETLVAVMSEQPEMFRSARLWNECKTFVRTANGRPEAAPGAHDDCVMAMGIALAVRQEVGGRKK
jgi:hypothetical protein